MATNVFEGHIQRLLNTYGFLIAETSGQKYFFSINESFTLWAKLRVGDTVSFMTGSTRGPHPEAIYIHKESPTSTGQSKTQKPQKSPKNLTTSPKPKQQQISGWILEPPTIHVPGHIASNFDEIWIIIKYCNTAVQNSVQLSALTGGAEILFTLKQQEDTVCYFAENISLMHNAVEPLRGLAVGQTQKTGWIVQQFEDEYRMGFIVFKIHGEWRFVEFRETSFQCSNDYDSVEIGQPVCFKTSWNRAFWTYKAGHIMFL